MNERKGLLSEIGERLRTRRVEMKMTQNEAAELLDMSLNYYGTIERGKNGLSLEKLLLVKEKMGLDITYLLTGEEAREVTFSDIISQCPRDKQYSMERLIDYALRLAKED